MNRTILALLGILALAALTAAVAVGAFDYWCMRSVMDLFGNGLSEVDLVNPHFMKAALSAIGAIGGFLYLRFFAMSPKFAVEKLGYGVVSFSALTAIAQLGLGVSTIGHYFDILGQSWVRYEITPENAVVFYSKREISPRSGKSLLPVTSEVIRELELRGSGGNREVNDPPVSRWFATGTGEPRLWFARRIDGDIHLFDKPGFDPGSAGELQGVTAAVQQEYYGQRKLDTERAADLEKKQREERVARDVAEAKKGLVVAARDAKTNETERDGNFAANQKQRKAGDPTGGGIEVANLRAPGLDRVERGGETDRDVSEPDGVEVLVRGHDPYRHLDYITILVDGIKHTCSWPDSHGMPVSLAVMADKLRSADAAGIQHFRGEQAAPRSTSANDSNHDYVVGPTGQIRDAYHPVVRTYR